MTEPTQCPNCGKYGETIKTITLYHFATNDRYSHFHQRECMLCGHTFCTFATDVIDGEDTRVENAGYADWREVEILNVRYQGIPDNQTLHAYWIGATP